MARVPAGQPDWSFLPAHLLYATPTAAQEAQVRHYWAETLIGRNQFALLHNGKSGNQRRCILRLDAMGNDGGWLNDEVVNEFGFLINMRQLQLQGISPTFPKAVVFNSFFYDKLTDLSEPR